jgi:hypothetical protein
MERARWSRFRGSPRGCIYLDTYMRLWWEHDEAHREELAGMTEWLDKLKP